MEQTKVYKLLTYFDRIEHNRLRKFVASPYFNPNEHVLNLYQILREHLFANSNKELEKENVWEALELGRGDYDDVYFRKLCSDLVKLIEQYLAQQVYEANQMSTKVDLIKAVGDRKIEPLYESSVRAARKQSAKEQINEAEFYLAQYKLEKNNYELVRQSSFERVKRTNFEEISNNLDLFFIAEKLKYYSNMLSQKLVAQHDYEMQFLSEIEQLIQENPKTLTVPVVAAYYTIYLTQKEPEKLDYFFELKAMIRQYTEQFSVSDRIYIYNYALNYCVRKINRGNTDFLEEYFEIYVDALESETMYTPEGELSPWHFRNLVVSALRLGKYDWVEEFIDNYQNRLPQAQRENAVTFNLANLHLYRKQYDKVIELLREVEYDDFSYNLNSKTMLLLTYYESDEFEILESLLESFRVFLNRHKDIPSSRRNPYMSLIRLTKKLIRIIPGDKKAIEKLKNEISKISKKEKIANEPWLLEKLQELE